MACILAQCIRHTDMLWHWHLSVFLCIVCRLPTFTAWELFKQSSAIQFYFCCRDVVIKFHCRNCYCCHAECRSENIPSRHYLFVKSPKLKSKIVLSIFRENTILCKIEMCTKRKANKINALAFVAIISFSLFWTFQKMVAATIVLTADWTKTDASKLFKHTNCINFVRSEARKK